MTDHTLPLMRFLGPRPDLPMKVCDWCDEYSRPDTEGEAVREALTALREQVDRLHEAALGVYEMRIAYGQVLTLIDERLKP